MSRDEERALLMLFSEWLGMDDGPAESYVDAFLASRPARSIKIPGPTGPISLTPLCDDCELTDDHCPTCDRKPCSRP